jgi:hypothetical protein
MGSLISIVVAVLGVYSIVRRLGRWKDRGEERRLLRRLRQTPASLIAESHEGREIKIEGRLRLLQASYETPHARERCAVFEAYAREGRDGSGAPLAYAVARADFAVEDDSSRAIIRVEGAKLLLYPTHLRQQSARQIDSEIADFIRQYGDGRSPAGGFLYCEAALREGEFVQVLGWASREATNDPTAVHTAREPAAGLVLRAAPEAELLISSYSPHAISLFALPDRNLDQGALDAVAAPRQSDR